MDPSSLNLIPEAPRVSGTTYPKNWDWRILESDDSAHKGIRKVVSGIDSDSAFGSAESTSKSEQVIYYHCHRLGLILSKIRIFSRHVLQ